MNSVFCLLFVEECQVKKVLFPLGEKGLWWYKVYVVLSSEDDVNRAIAKNGLMTGKFSIRGWY